VGVSWWRRKRGYSSGGDLALEIQYTDSDAIVFDMDRTCRPGNAIDGEVEPRSGLARSVERVYPGQGPLLPRWSVVTVQEDDIWGVGTHVN